MRMGRNTEQLLACSMMNHEPAARLRGRIPSTAGEVMLYAEDGAEIAIYNGWLEQPPMADDRKALARHK
ncbi:hypothetical protein [Alicyclobacillus fastidiosus]|uniref:hypothetical protein n=1 Tax=Alicyclobacillus fastidiosus TaxID=392011 RepID=UPI0024E0E38A|nr:hypothetical protein [Alicyclobacillus fastidiosus]